MAKRSATKRAHMREDCACALHPLYHGADCPHPHANQTKQVKSNLVQTPPEYKYSWKEVTHSLESSHLTPGALQYTKHSPKIFSTKGALRLLMTIFYMQASHVQALNAFYCSYSYHESQAIITFRDLPSLSYCTP
eukprot:1160071-Pelagomonas_calceolata.AAC.3